MRFLIVDDRPENQLLLREQLRDTRADITMADSGARALRELRTGHFDLVITDLLMPEMDGFQLCYLLKTETLQQRTPVIIYTANYATKKDEEHAKELGADDFITRPIEEDELTARIYQVLEKARAGMVAEPRAKPQQEFFREYSTLLIQKLEDQLITAEENVKLLARNAELHEQIERKNGELECANQELRSANADLEAFSYSVSHDLRAPIRGIEGMFDMLMEEVGSQLTPEGQHYAERIRHNIRRMHDLIRGLLTHTRMRSAAASLQPTDLAAVLDGAIATLEYAIRSSGATVVTKGLFPAVIANPEALQQIVTNLLDNALKFVAPGAVPHVTIDCERRDGRVRLNVRDNGIGIPVEHRGRLFGIFERLHTDAAYTGTGLGLAIVRRGIERMGGAVGVDSQPGQGSTFWIELPQAPGAGE